MSMALLDAPLRVTWDLSGPDGFAPETTALTIAERLVEAGVFFVTLEHCPLAHPAIRPLLAHLKAGGVRSQVIFAGTDEEWRGIASDPGSCELLVDAGAYLVTGAAEEFSALANGVERLRQAGYEPALTFLADRARLLLLPRLLDFCRSAAINRIKLPNTPIDASFEVSKQLERLPTHEDLERLRATISDPLGLRANVAMEVHDLFLWELFFPGERETGRVEYGGCQAGNSLAHIDVNGIVHPCSSWPQALGSLLTMSLDELWQGALRHQVRAEVAQVPVGCSGCRDYALCFGGCRGLSRTLTPHSDGRDLLCQEKR